MIPGRSWATGRRWPIAIAAAIARLASPWPLALLLALVAAPCAARGQATAPPSAGRKVILFVGNSFFHGAFAPVLHYNADAVTDENFSAPRGSPRSEGNATVPYGGIPAIFKKMTDEAGLNYEVHSELMSGKSLEYHYANALAIINQPKWNIVVLHDYSTQPVPVTRTGNPESFYKYATLMEQTIHAANPSAELFLYETWPRADLTYPAGTPYFGQPIDVMGSDLHDAYYREFAQDAHFRGVIPAGDAWLRAIHGGVAEADPYHHEAGKLNLWAVDRYHPSIYGAYLNALLLFDEITGKDPRTLGTSEQAAAALGISPSDAATLERLAFEEINAAPPKR